MTNTLYKAENLRVAVIHDWIFTRRGGEKVLERILNLFPQAHLYCLFGNPDGILKLNQKHVFFTSFLNKIPFISKIYKLLLPLFPMAIESFNLSRYDLIISTSSCVAKGIIPPPHSKHVCYIHSPMRYAWDQEHLYFKNIVTLLRPREILRRVFLSRLRIWDVTSSHRIDKLVANSHFVARRCALYYGKKADIIFPPIDIQYFKSTIQAKMQGSISRTLPEAVQFKQPHKKVLLFGAWVPYKKMFEALCLLVENNIDVIAAGQGEDLLAAQEKFGDKVEFYIAPSDEKILEIYSRAHVLLFPAIEDFGIVPLEATASGLWVVAPNDGGTKETVLNEITGFTFQEGNNEEMLACVKKALDKEIFLENLNDMEIHAGQFSPQLFDVNILGAVHSAIA